jgi:hypothetical protein
MSNPYDMQNLTLELGKLEFGIAHHTVNFKELTALEMEWFKVGIIQ